MSEHLWTRKLSYHVVEALVGTSWTQVAKTENGEEAACDAATLALDDASVKAVRVTSHEIEHICAAVENREAPIRVTVPRTMSRTDRVGVCRVCFGRTAIAQNKNDETDCWALCEAGHSLPVVL